MRFQFIDDRVFLELYFLFFASLALLQEILYKQKLVDDRSGSSIYWKFVINKGGAYPLVIGFWG